ALRRRLALGSAGAGLRWLLTLLLSIVFRVLRRVGRLTLRLIRRLARSLVLLVLALILWRVLILPECVDLAFHQIAIELAVRVIGAQLQRRLVGLDGVVPFLQCFLRRGLCALLSRAIQRIAEVVVGIFLIGQALRIARWRFGDRLLECLRRLRELPGSVRGGAYIVLQSGLGGIALRCGRIGSFGWAEITFLISLRGAQRAGARKVTGGDREQQKDDGQGGDSRRGARRGAARAFGWGMGRHAGGDTAARHGAPPRADQQTA